MFFFLPPFVLGSAPGLMCFRSVPPSRLRGLSFVTKSRRRSSGGLRCCCLWYTIWTAICQYTFLQIYKFFRISAESAQDQPQGAPDQRKKEISVESQEIKKELERDYIYIYYRADNARMICGRNSSRPPPLEAPDRIRAPCHPLPGLRSDQKERAPPPGLRSARKAGRPRPPIGPRSAPRTTPKPTPGGP